jgi:flavodoxin
MKSLVVFSSRTGNTHKVARAIFEVLPDEKQLFPVEEAPPVAGYDFVAIGFWVDRGSPDKKSLDYMRTLSGARVGLFGTLGAKPDSAHAEEVVSRAVELLGDCRVEGSFLCQGRIDPGVVEMMKRVASDVHPMTPERIVNIEAAAAHPDDEDLRNARKAFAKILQQIKQQEVL